MVTGDGGNSERGNIHNTIYISPLAQTWKTQQFSDNKPMTHGRKSYPLTAETGLYALHLLTVKSAIYVLIM